VNPLTTLASTPYLILLPVTLGYAGLCWVRPFGPCRKCRPRINQKPRRRARLYCRRCNNTRLRLRTGRRVWNFVHRLYTEGTR
jgi:hypothetical protein